MTSPDFHLTDEQWNGSGRKHGIAYYATQIGIPATPENRKRIETAVFNYIAVTEEEDEKKTDDVAKIEQV